MLYNTKNPYEKVAFLAKAEALAEKEAVVELSEKAARTLRQNSYLHLIIGIVAKELGTNIDDAKMTYYKLVANREIFVRRKMDKVLGMEREYLRSSKELNKDEMSKSIDRFKQWAAQNKIILPEPEDKEMLLSAEVYIQDIQNYY